MRVKAALGLGLALGFAMGAISVGSIAAYSAIQAVERERSELKEWKISNLTLPEIAQLENGTGYGWAKPAEYNGYPNPFQIALYERKLLLDDKQKALLERIQLTEITGARKVGERVINAHEQLDLIFSKGPVSSQRISEASQRVANVESELRTIHLNARLQSKTLLNSTQLRLYCSTRKNPAIRCNK